LEFHGERVFSQLGEAEVSAFLTSLAVDGAVSASTQNQALYAILFLYRNVLGRDLAWLEDVVRAKRPLRLPTVLARGDVARLIAKLEGTPKLVASLLYGSGLRLLEGLTLWIIGCTGTIYTRP
jgi:site-specific recombinase XerD